MKFSVIPCKKKNNTKYFAIQLIDDCEIKTDRDIAEKLGLVTKSYRNILRKFNAEMKSEKDINIAFETIEDVYKAIEHLENTYQDKSVKFRKTETEVGYIYGECTNEFIEQYKELVPTITYMEVMMNSISNIKTDWDTICKLYMLDEEFIEDCSEKINWVLISKYQNLSLDFILKNKDKLDLEIMEFNVKLSQEIKEEVLKMVAKKSTSSDASKEMLGQMLGLNPEQLNKIGSVVQIGGPSNLEEDE